MKKEVPIVGMHCKACEKLIGDELRELSGVQSVRVSLKNQEAIITANEMPSDTEISGAVKRAGYKVGMEELPLISHDTSDYKILVVGIIIAAVVLFALGKLGGLNIATGSTNNVWAGLLMGLAAGFSTCMALVGGLVVAIGARHEARHPNASRIQNFHPHIFFNIGRIIGFTLLGALIGLVGSALTFSPLVLGILTALAGLVMLVVGLQLTGIFPRLTAFALPTKLSEKLGLDNHKSKEYSHSRAVLLGALTFFLPCGFTQAMQLTAVASGSWITGGLMMGLFAIGTTPGLLAVGGLTSLIRGAKAKLILKIIGVVVVGLALGSILTGAKLSGINFDLPEFNNTTEQTSDITEITTIYDGSQKGFSPNKINVEVGKKYRLRITSTVDEYGCMNTIMLPELSDQSPQLIQKNKTITIDFVAKSAGEYQPTCAMGLPFDLKVVAK
jgi:sulfite exporter TauE/SafE/copper chaperone CopZ